VDDRALDHALEAGGGLGVVLVVDDQRVELGVEIGGDRLLERLQVDAAGLHDLGASRSSTSESSRCSSVAYSCDRVLA
jgi:hypothetical protein